MNDGLNCLLFICVLCKIFGPALYFLASASRPQPTARRRRRW